MLRNQLAGAAEQVRQWPGRLLRWTTKQHQLPVSPYKLSVFFFLFSAVLITFGLRNFLVSRGIRQIRVRYDHKWVE